MVTLKDEGDKIVQQINLHVFVKGAWNKGPVIEAREATSANLSPGLGVIHGTGAGGEDDYTEHAANSALYYALIELDENQIESCSSTYAQYDNVPGIPYHMNPGAYVRNISISDPATNLDPDTPLCAHTSGRFIDAIECVLVACNSGTTESFTAAATSGKNSATGATIHSRIILRNAYYVADPGETQNRVAYIATGE